LGKKKKKRSVDVDLISLINQGVLLARAARIINTRHATRHPNAIFHVFTSLCSFLDSFRQFFSIDQGG